MNIIKLMYRLIPPCPRCPYVLGLINTFANPCPQCKENGYESFEWFHREVSGGIPASSSEDY